MDIAFYVFMTFFFIALALAVLTLNAISVVFGILMLSISIFVYKGWYILEDLIFKHSNIIELLGGYELSGNRFTAIRKTGNVFISTTAAAIDTSHIGEMDREKLENLIKNTNKPFKLVMYVQKLNTSKMFNELKTKQYMKEKEIERASRSKYNEGKVNHLKREIIQIENDVNEITSGKIPLKLAYYIVASSYSESMFTAQENAIFSIKEISNAFNGILNSEVRLLEGEELAELLRFDSTMVF